MTKEERDAIRARYLADNFVDTHEWAQWINEIIPALLDALEEMEQVFPASDYVTLWKRGEEYKTELERVTAERDAAIADFHDYATQGSDNFAPFCKNAASDCVDARGWCIDNKCKGRTWRGMEDEGTG